MKHFLNFLKKQPLLCGILAIAVAIISIHYNPTDGLLAGGLLRMLLSATMAFFLYLISGKKTLENCGHDVGYTIKVMMPYIIIAVVLGVLSLFSAFANNTLQADWYIRLPLLFFEMIFVGLFEEVAFRAVINDAIVYQFRNFKYVFVLSAIAVTFLFGWGHIAFADVSTPLLLSQAVAKILSSGLFGLALLFMYWKTRNIWACALVHAIYDFLLSLSMAFFQIEPVTSYVKTGDVGLAGLIAMSLQTIFAVIICIVVWKKVGRNMDFEEMRQNW
jgi:membrane protease YdiL (CAAX protease family)